MTLDTEKTFSSPDNPTPRAPSWAQGAGQSANAAKIVCRDCGADLSSRKAYYSVIKGMQCPECWVKADP